MISNSIKINLGHFLEDQKFKNSKEEIEASLKLYEISEEKMEVNCNTPSWALDGFLNITSHKAWHVLAMVLNTNLLWLSFLKKANITKENKEILLEILLQSGKTTGFLLCEKARWWNTLTTEELGIISLGLSKNPLPQEINQYILSFIAIDTVEKESLKPFLPLLKNNINKSLHKEIQRWLLEYISDLIALCVYYYRINFQFDAGCEYTKEQIKILKENLKIELRKLDYCKFFNPKFKNILTHEFVEAGRKQTIFNRTELLLLLKRAHEIYTSPSMTQNGIFKKRKIESISDAFWIASLRSQ
jgi:hypothetical protein